MLFVCLYLWRKLKWSWLKWNVFMSVYPDYRWFCTTWCFAVISCRFILCHMRSCSNALQNWIQRWSVKLKSCGNVTRLSDSPLLMQLMLKRGGYKSTNVINLSVSSWVVHLHWWISSVVHIHVVYHVQLTSLRFQKSKIISSTVNGVGHHVYSCNGLNYEICDRNCNITDSAKCCVYICMDPTRFFLSDKIWFLSGCVFHTLSLQCGCFWYLVCLTGASDSGYEPLTMTAVCFNLCWQLTENPKSAVCWY